MSAWPHDPDTYAVLQDLAEEMHGPLGRTARRLGTRDHDHALMAHASTTDPDNDFIMVFVQERQAGTAFGNKAFPIITGDVICRPEDAAERALEWLIAHRDHKETS